MESMIVSVIPKIPSIKPAHLHLHQFHQPTNCSLNLQIGSHLNSSFLKLGIISRLNPRAFLKWMSSCFCDIPSSMASWIIPIYLFSFSPVAIAHENALVPASYPCEDVQSYYNGTDNMEGEALGRKLNSIIAGHHSLSYREVWDALKILDVAEVDEPEMSHEIVEIYSLRNVPKNMAGKLEGWNREHLWPRSYGLIHRPSLTDLHNIRPADVNVNSARGNKYFGECHVGVKHCKKPANKEAAPDTETDREIWAPSFRVRGDVARALMYMAIRYGFLQPGEGPILRLSDSPSIARREMGILSILKKWNKVDPPSREEKLRNERVCKLYQHNRNPFIDHPEYANRIWKRATSSYRNFIRT